MNDAILDCLLVLISHIQNMCKVTKMCGKYRFTRDGRRLSRLLNLLANTNNIFCSKARTRSQRQMERRSSLSAASEDA